MLSPVSFVVRGSVIPQTSFIKTPAPSIVRYFKAVRRYFEIGNSAKFKNYG